MIEVGSTAVVNNPFSYYDKIVVNVYHVVEDGSGVQWVLTDAPVTKMQDSVWFKVSELEVM